MAEDKKAAPTKTSVKKSAKPSPKTESSPPKKNTLQRKIWKWFRAQRLSYKIIIILVIIGFITKLIEKL